MEAKIIWLVVWNIFYFSIYWEESSQLIFQRGRSTTNLIYLGLKKPHLLIIFRSITWQDPTAAEAIRKALQGTTSAPLALSMKEERWDVAFKHGGLTNNN